MPRAWLPPLPPPLDTERWHDCIGCQNITVTGTVYTDGSARSRSTGPRSTGLGGGHAVMQGRRLQGMAFGPLPGPQQTVLRAELYAVFQAPKHGTQPLHIKTDCCGIAESLERGRQCCTHVRRENVDLWY